MNLSNIENDKGINLVFENLLKKIDTPDDLKKLSEKQLKKLAGEIRQFLVRNISKTGGHLASNLGAVELTLALHYIFDTPDDRIVWDVGHQAYVHKLVTGRKDAFDTIRQLKGISGFPKSEESIYDTFNTGHSSTSISAALGMARARDIKGEKYNVIAVIGDGALTGGMSFEALNDAGRSPNNFIVVLNDNEMSISKNVGGLSGYLSKIRTEPIYYKVKEDIDIILKKIPAIGKSAVKALDMVKGSIKYLIMPGVIFEELGFKYLGPIDGHNIDELGYVFKRAKTLKGPVLIHVCTKKGKGYSHAEQNPHIFHGISPFEVVTGELKKIKKTGYSKVFGNKLIKLAEKEKRLVAITAAMPDGTGLKEFSKKFKDRFYDVGIAEQHAVTLAAGLARNGMLPVVAIYSTFLQRSYDQIIHDVAMQNLHVVFAIDRAGIVGEDGETHQGVFDLSYLGHIPNMTVLAPCDYLEFRAMLEYAVFIHRGPVAIRYPRGSGSEKICECVPVNKGKAVKIKEGSDVTIAAVGSMVKSAVEIGEKLNESGASAEIINARFIKPIDRKMIANSILKTKKLVTIEDNIVTGGMGNSVLQFISDEGIEGIRTKVFGFPDKFIEHGSRDSLIKKYGLDTDSLTRKIIKML